MNEEIEKIIAQPYHITVVHDTDGYTAWVQEWPGCITSADTWEELLPMIQDAMRGYAAIGIEDGVPLPPPQED